MFLNEAMFEEAKEIYKKVKTVGIVISILMIILGLVMFFLPVSATAVAMWLMFVGLLILGVLKIVIYCKLPSNAKDGWTLASGIIWTLIGLLLVVNGLSASTLERFVAWGNFEMVIAFMVAFTSIFNGIETLCSSKMVTAMGGSKTWCIISGILGIVVGLIILTYPIGSMITLIMFYGLFLVIGGIALLCQTLSF